MFSDMKKTTRIIKELTSVGKEHKADFVYMRNVWSENNVTLE